MYIILFKNGIVVTCSYFETLSSNGKKTLLYKPSSEQRGRSVDLEDIEAIYNYRRDCIYDQDTYFFEEP